MSNETLDRRVSSARAELRAALDPTPPDFARIAHRAQVRRHAVAATLTTLLAAGAVLAVVVRDGDDRANVVTTPGPSPTTTTTTTMPPSAPTAGAAFHSSTTLVRGVPTVLAAYAASSGTAGRIDVLEWDGGWRTAASFDVPAPGVPAEEEEARPLVVRDVTGDDEPDFVVPLEAASTAPYEVVSDHGGSWRQVPFGSDDRIVVTEPDEPTADRFVTSTNLCEPTCSDGRYRRELWRYSPSEGRFTLVTSTVCQATTSSRWRCDPADSPLVDGERIGPS